MWLPLVCSLLGTWPTTQAFALTGNQICNPLVRRPVLSPLSHTSQGPGKLFRQHAPQAAQPSAVGAGQVHACKSAGTGLCGPAVGLWLFWVRCFIGNALNKYFCACFIPFSGGTVVRKRRMRSLLFRASMSCGGWGSTCTREKEFYSNFRRPRSKGAVKCFSQ